MLREIGRRNPSIDGVSYWVLKVGCELEKRRTMEIVKSVQDLGTVLVFIGIAMTPRAILTYFALRDEK
jgi:hypothetical protein